MMGETEKQKAIRALFPSIAGVLEQGGDWQSSPAGRLRRREGPPRVVGWDEWGREPSAGADSSGSSMPGWEDEQGDQDTHLTA